MTNFYRGCLKQSIGLMLDSLTITSLPTKTSYKTGETIDATGMVVNATSDTFSGNVTAHCTIVPQVAGSEEGTQAIMVIYGNLSTTFNITVTTL